jgi:hypothetical protein
MTTNLRSAGDRLLNFFAVAWLVFEEDFLGDIGAGETDNAVNPRTVSSGNQGNYLGFFISFSIVETALSGGNPMRIRLRMFWGEEQQELRTQSCSFISRLPDRHFAPRLHVKNIRKEFRVELIDGLDCLKKEREVLCEDLRQNGIDDVIPADPE